MKEIVCHPVFDLNSAVVEALEGSDDHWVEGKIKLCVVGIEMELNVMLRYHQREAYR